MQGEMSHTTQGNAEKFVVVLRSIPKIIVPAAEGHQELCGSRLEIPHGTSQGHGMALASHQHGLGDAESSFGAPDGIVLS